MTQAHRTELIASLYGKESPELIAVLEKLLATPDEYNRYSGCQHFTGGRDGTKGKAAILLGSQSDAKLDGKTLGAFKWCQSMGAVVASTDSNTGTRRYTITVQEIHRATADGINPPITVELVATGDSIPEVNTDDIFWFIYDINGNAISPGTSRRWIPFKCNATVPAYGAMVGKGTSTIEDGRFVFDMLKPTVTGGNHHTFVNSNVACNAGDIGLCTVAGEFPVTVLTDATVNDSMFCGPIAASFTMAAGSAGFYVVGTDGSNKIVIRNDADTTRKAKLTGGTLLPGGSQVGKLYYVDGGLETLAVGTVTIHDVGYLESTIVKDSGIFVQWFPDRQQWILVKAYPPLRRKAKLTGGTLSRGGSQTAKLYTMSAAGVESLDTASMVVYDLGILEVGETLADNSDVIVSWWQDRLKWVLEHQMTYTYQTVRLLEHDATKADPNRVVHKHSDNICFPLLNVNIRQHLTVAENGETCVYPCCDSSASPPQGANPAFSNPDEPVSCYEVRQRRQACLACQVWDHETEACRLKQGSDLPPWTDCPKGMW